MNRMLTALAAVLAAAFVVAPPVLTGIGGHEELVGAARAAFGEYLGSGGPDLTPAMADVVTTWAWYHVAKAVLAAALAAVCVVLGGALWTAYVRDGNRLRGVAGAAVSVVAVAAVVVVMANVQGAVAPFASLLPLLPPGAGPLPGPVEAAMLADFTRFHAVMAGLAAVALAGFAGVGARSWLRFARTDDRRVRHVAAARGMLTTVTVVATAVVLLANVSTATDPGPAFQALLDGSW